MSWGVPARGNSGLLIPPHFFDRRILTVDTFIDIVGQNWSGNTKLCTPLQDTVIQGSLPPRWPQLSQIAWFSGKSYVYKLIKRRFPATLTNYLFIRYYNSRFFHLQRGHGGGHDQTHRAGVDPNPLLNSPTGRCYSTIELIAPSSPEPAATARSSSLQPQASGSRTTGICLLRADFLRGKPHIPLAWLSEERHVKALHRRRWRRHGIRAMRGSRASNLQRDGGGHDRTHRAGVDPNPLSNSPTGCVLTAKLKAPGAFIIYVTDIVSRDKRLMVRTVTFYIAGGSAALGRDDVREERASSSGRIGEVPPVLGTDRKRKLCRGFSVAFRAGEGISGIVIHIPRKF